MIAAAQPAACRRVRLNRPRNTNQYELKERFVSMCKERSIEVLTLRDISVNQWTQKKNQRRCQLIDRSLQAELTTAEQRELKNLQEEAEAYFDELAPPPIQGALMLHAELLKLANNSRQ